MKKKSKKSTKSTKTKKTQKSKKPSKSVKTIEVIKPISPQIEAQHIFSMLDDKDILAVLISRLENKVAEVQSNLGYYQWIKKRNKTETKTLRRLTANEKKLKAAVKNLKSANKLNMKLVDAYL